LCHQGLAGLPVVAARPIPGGQLLIRLRCIAGGALPQQLPPVLGILCVRHTRISQPVNREPLVRIGLVLRPRRSEHELPARPHICQVDCRTLTSAGGGEPAAEVHTLADLQAIGVQGGARVVVQSRPGAVEVATDVGADQVDRAIAAAAGGGEPVAEKQRWPTCRPSAVRAGPESLRSSAPVQLRLPPI
jgi:hypothetical protein